MADQRQTAYKDQDGLGLLPGLHVSLRRIYRPVALSSYRFSLTFPLHLQTLLLSPSEGGVREGEVSAGISDQWSHRSRTLSCQQGAGSGNGRTARTGLISSDFSFISFLAFHISFTACVMWPGFMQRFMCNSGPGLKTVISATFFVIFYVIYRWIMSYPLLD